MTAHHHRTCLRTAREQFPDMKIFGPLREAVAPTTTSGVLYRELWGSRRHLAIFAELADAMGIDCERIASSEPDWPPSPVPDAVVEHRRGGLQDIVGAIRGSSLMSPQIARRASFIMHLSAWPKLWNSGFAAGFASRGFRCGQRPKSSGRPLIRAHAKAWRDCWKRAVAALPNSPRLREFWRTTCPSRCWRVLEFYRTTPGRNFPRARTRLRAEWRGLGMTGFAVGRRDERAGRPPGQPSAWWQLWHTGDVERRRTDRGSDCGQGVVLGRSHSGWQGNRISAGASPVFCPPRRRAAIVCSILAAALGSFFDTVL